MTQDHIMMVCLAAIFVMLDTVAAFSIGRRSVRSTDLADALSILQRQRRRIDSSSLPSSDPFASERPRGARALRADDIRDWLSAGGLAGQMLPSGVLRPGEDMEDRMTDEGRLIEEPYGEGRLRIGDEAWGPNSDLIRRQFNRDNLVYDYSELLRDQHISPQENTYVTEATKSELDNIFEPDSKSELDDIFDDEVKPSNVKKSAKNPPTKKNKEEALNVAVNNKKVIKKKSVGSVVKPEFADDLSLDSLTKEEFQALMKAVQKIKNRSAKSNKRDGLNGAVKETLTVQDPSGEVVGGEVNETPLGTDELNEVFDDEEEEEDEDDEEEKLEEGDEDDDPVTTEEISEMNMAQSSGPEGTITQTVETNLGGEPSEDDQRQLGLDEAFLSDLDAELEKAEEEDELQKAEEMDFESRIVAEEVATAALEDAINDVEYAREEELEPEPVASDNKVSKRSDNSDASLLNSDIIKDLEMKYRIMNQYLNKQPASAKRTTKRSAFFEDEIPDTQDDDIIDDGEPEVLAQLRHGSVPTVQAFVEKILDLQSELDRLRTVMSLEDLENDQLTDALNEATLAQGRGSVSGTELGALQRAIRIEEAIQDIKTVASPPPSASRTNPTHRKRGEPWGRKRDQDPEVADDVDDRLPVFPDSRAPPMSPKDVERAFAQAMVIQTKPRGGLGGSRDGLGGSRGRLGGSRDGVASSLSHDADEADTASLFDPDADQCPAVARYSTNCALADVFNLPVDMEARALCNLHEMCYACGASLAVGQSQCDVMYRAASAQLCQDGERCLLEAEVFLSTMRLKHRYTSHRQEGCRSVCAARYLGLV